MFIPGTKVKVIASSFKKSGPKVGSTGFFSGSNRTTDYYDDESVVVNFSDIVFNRYGYEEPCRHEVRSLPIILPLKNDSPSKRKAYTKWIENKLDSLIKSGTLTKIASSYKDEGHWISLVLERHENIKKMDINTWISWVSSMLISSHVKEFVYSDTTRRILSQKIPSFGNFVDTINLMKEDRAYRFAELKASFESPVGNSNMMKIIEVLRYILQRKIATAYRKNSEEFLKNLLGGIQLEDKIKLPKALSFIINYIATPQFRMAFNVVMTDPTYKQNNTITNMVNLNKWMCSYNTFSGTD
jgi:hypothetical protein